MTSKTQTYDAAADLATRWPEWRLLKTNLGGLPEVICDTEHLMLIDVAAWPEGESFAVAHCLAHLDLEHHLLNGDLSGEHEDQADWLAKIRLDEEWRP